MKTAMAVAATAMTMGCQVRCLIPPSSGQDLVITIRVAAGAGITAQKRTYS
jgi:hypothetical protein